MLSRRLGLSLGVGLLVCAPFVAVAMPNVVPVAPVLPQASHSEAGTIQDACNGRLLLAPYARAGHVLELTYAPTIPVFAGAGRAGTVDLHRGQSARVYFEAGWPGQLPRVAAVELLNPDEARRAMADADMPRAMPAKEAVLAQATGNQAGTIRAFGDGWLALTPYERRAGEAHLQLRWETPVFAGPSRVALASVAPGSDVRIYYRERWHERPVVVAIELLSPEQTREAQWRDNPHDEGDRVARHMQAGHVIALTDGYLTIDPYQGWGGDTRLRFEGDVPITAGGTRVGPGALTPGSDVRVFYGANRVVSVEILSWDEARRLEREGMARRW